VLTAVEFPLGYVHGVNEVLSPRSWPSWKAKRAGDIIEVDRRQQAVRARDESLVITDHIENVPEEYREVGTKHRDGERQGSDQEFLVTRIDEKTLTIDGNNPLCGRASDLSSSRS
jgi:FKBP-type peptidyl-prolyl cis-trans isomerase SlyD